MNILNSNVLLQLNGATEVANSKFDASVAGSSDRTGQSSFPTLLSIPWDQQAKNQPDLREEFPNSEAAVDPNIVEMLMSSGKETEDAIKDILETSDTGKVLLGGDLAKAIAQILTFNSNATGPIDVVHEGGADQEKQLLIDRYQQVSSLGNGPVFSWSLNHAPNIGSTNVKQSSNLNLEPLSRGMQQYTLPTKQEPVKQVSNSRTPAQYINSSVSDIVVPERPTESSAKANPTSVSYNPNQQNTMTAANNGAATFVQPQRTDSGVKIPSEPIFLENQVRVTSAKSENHISFLQPSLPAQVPQLVARVATGMQTSGTPETSIDRTAVPSTTKAVARIEVQLVPKNLGTVHISVQKQDGMISVLIRAETAEAEKILSTESGAVREAIKSAGLTLDEIRIQPLNVNDRDAEARFSKSVDMESENSSGFSDSRESGQKGEQYQHTNLDENQNLSLADLPAENDLIEKEARTGLYL